jgi:hypothetical protein
LKFSESFSKTGEIGTGRLSKVVGAVLPTFQKRIVHREPICQISNPAAAPCRFTKALGANLRHLPPKRRKGFELAGFEKLSTNSNAFGAKWLRT